MANRWKNYRKMKREESCIWVHKDGVKWFRKIGWKLVRK